MKYVTALSSSLLNFLKQNVGLQQMMPVLGSVTVLNISLAPPQNEKHGMDEPRRLSSMEGETEMRPPRWPRELRPEAVQVGRAVLCGLWRRRLF